ncbi:MAG: NADH-quinone oxidoreductase subunit L [Thermofilum sp.]
MEELLILAWLAPYVGAALVLVLSRASWGAKSLVAILSILVSALASSAGAAMVASGHEVHVSATWIESLSVRVGVLFDGLSSLMALVVSWLSFLIAVYSYEYMRGEGGETRYWFFFTFFVGSMMLLVLSDNLLAMLVGWEGTGLASYALIGHWFSDEEERWVGDPERRALKVPMWSEPSHSGLRALVFTRVGDVGMIVGIATLHTVLGTTLLQQLADGAWASKLLAAGVLPAFLWLLFLGAMAKSAQFPFHEWLVTAMTGPTSVSALIHAATMVKAGVYFLLRFTPFLVAAAGIAGAAGVIHGFLEALALLGSFTAFMMATMALVSRELKLVLAFSTASQLGYMFLGAAAGALAAGAVGGLAAGFSHLLSHAVFKASLFLAAGAVIHAVHSRFIDDMGGLAGPMRLTAASFLLAGLSLAGIPPFMGFWTKDEVIHYASEAGLLAPTLLAVVTAALTACYTARVFSRVFLGAAHAHGHEPGLAMLAPYLSLGFASAALGLAWPLVSPRLEEVLHHSVGVKPAKEAHTLAAIPGAVEAALVLALAAFSVTLYAYGWAGIHPYQRVSRSRILSGLHSFLYDRWLVNGIYYRVIVGGFRQLSIILYRFFDTAFIDRLYHSAIPRFFQGAAGFASRVLESGYDSLLHRHLVNAFTGLWRAFRSLQTGKAPHYIALMWIGASLLLLALVLGWFK